MQSEEESRHPLFRSYGTILPNSLALVLLPRLGLLCQGHLYWFSVRSHEIKRAFFSRAIGLDPTPLRGLFRTWRTAPLNETSFAWFR